MSLGGPRMNSRLALTQRLRQYFRVGMPLKFLHLLLLVLPVSGFGQTPLKVGLCDLIRDPQKYSRQWVEVRAAVNIGFENFTLRSAGCGGSSFSGIWLTYGGDEPTPITSTVNDRMRKPGIVMKVDEIPVPLDRNSDLELFKERLVAQRVAAPDGSSCGGDCHLYNVIATFIGLFMAAPTDKNGKWNGGYGHLGCCHLLAIRRVADVEAVRTEIPAGGRFTCSKETWEMDQSQATEALRHRSCSDMADCRKAVGEQFRIVADHWGDNEDLSKGMAHNFLNGAPTWRSADQLTTYLLEGHYTDKKRGTGRLLGATAARTFCKPIEPPYPQTTLISCRNLFSDFYVSEKSAGAQDHTQKNTHWVGDPETIAPQALEHAAKSWNVTLLPGLTLKECDKPVVDKGNQFTWCSWTEPTSMQSFFVGITRSHLKHAANSAAYSNNAPWHLLNGYGTSCTAEAR